MAVKIDLNDTVAKSIGMLEKKMMGGVSKESAERAIKTAANEIEDKMLKASNQEMIYAQGRHTMQMNEIKKSYMDSLNEKDREIMTLRKESSDAKSETVSISTKFAALLAQVKKAAAFKKIKTNPDGSEVFVKTNKNGAKMKKTVIPADKTADGTEKPVEIDVELADGRVRRTTYDADGFRKRTYTNAAEQPVEYLYRGGDADIRPLNAPKAKPAKPTPVGRPFTEYGTYDRSILTSKQEYSDGTHITTRIDRNSGKILSWEKKNSDGNFLESFETLRDGTKQHVTRKFNKDGSWGFEDVIELEYPNGIKMKRPYSSRKDELTGLDIQTNRISFPKTSNLKRIDTEWLNGGTPRKMTITKRNGDKYVLSDYEVQNANRELTPGIGLEIKVPTKAVIISKDGTITELKKDQIRPLLERIHPDFNFSLRQA